MNANELADNQLTHVIGENNNGEEVVITLKKPLYPESFVRQQQAEIDRLTMLCDCMTTESNRKGNEIEALKAGKIKAYDNGYEDGRKPNTHPVKDLEDIDINITWNENSMRDFGKDELAFARAILKKAQEK